MNEFEPTGKVPPMRRARRGFIARKWIIIVILLGLAAGGYAFWGSWNGPTVDLSKSPRCKVQKGDLTVTLLQTGELSAKRSITIKNEMERQTTIVSIVDDGSMVHKGDLLVELDSRDYQDNLLNARAEVAGQDADLLKSQKEVEIADQKYSTDKQTAELDVEVAKLDLEKYEEAEYKQNELKAKQAIMLAQEELKQAQEKLSWSEKLVKKGYASRQELEANELEVKRREIEWKNAQTDLDVLTSYTYQKESSQLKSKLVQAQATLASLLKTYEAQHARDLANVEASKSKLEAARLKLKQIEGTIEKSKVYADFDGLVFYPSVDPWERERAIEKGASVFPRQSILQFPDLSSWKIKTPVPESIIERVRVGMKALVTIDALPGALIDAVVEKVSIVPDRGRWFESTSKNYMVELDIPTTPTAKLKPGMSCMVEIIRDELHNVLYVPIQAVTGQAGKQTVYLVTAFNSYKKAPVTTGQNNDEYIQILSGLEEGQELLLYAPPAATKRTGIQERPLDKLKDQRKNGATEEKNGDKESTERGNKASEGGDENGAGGGKAPAEGNQEVKATSPDTDAKPQDNAQATPDKPTQTQAKKREA
jgi:HlyD family secretion protein